MSYISKTANKTSNQFVYTTNNTGSAGQFLTLTGTNGTSWATGTVNANPAITVNQTNPATIDVKGRMVINGRDLEERLDTIENVLQIPERDVKLEKKHPKLKKLYDDYINALGKYRTFEAIKGDDNE
jgi:D-arabinose 1-dehydrogenase-like Zn-dependent alcohol dehydrogenase